MSTGRIKIGEIFGVNHSIQSPNGIYILKFRDDGNLAFYKTKKGALWDTEIYLSYGSLRNDGNLRLFDEDNKEKWSSRTGGKGNDSSLLIVQDNGDVVIKSNDNVICSTNTTPKPIPEFPTVQGPPRDRLKANEFLNQGDGLTFPSGEYFLFMQGECVLFKRNKGSIWAQGRGARNSAEKLLFLSFGELEVLTWAGYRKWAAGTAGRGNQDSVLVLRDDGNMVIITEGLVVWTLGTGPNIPVPTVAMQSNDRIVGRERLGPGEGLTSPNRRFTLVFQSDANFVLYEGTSAKWACGNDDDANGESWIQLEKEGNLVQYASQEAGWSSRSRKRRTPGDVVLVLHCSET